MTLSSHTQAQPPEAENPGARQKQASNPLKSVWVGASAGTGKTKVLIDRVLRLMLPRPGMSVLSATRPEKILCLTFTKTAAAEMSNRIYERLAEWSVQPDAALHAALADLLAVAPDNDTVHAARRLFARVLDTPGGLKIMTLHSFCQSVLKRFPIEAGLPPHFELMDELSAEEYLRTCMHDIIAQTRRLPDTPLAQAFHQLAVLLTAEDMSNLMRQVMAKRSELAAILRHRNDAEGEALLTVGAIYETLGIRQSDTAEDVMREVGEIGPEHEEALLETLRALLKGSATDVKKADAMAPWLEDKAARVAQFNTYCEAFLTATGGIRDKQATNAVQKAFPPVLEIMHYEAERLVAARARIAAIRLAGVNRALLTVAAAMLGRYAAYKRARDSLDFDDLIIKTCELLSSREDVQWVLYKLDEGIDHILVDEAQDTSPAQWRVVQALTGEFFAGAGRQGYGDSGEAPRTLFVVGDEKQSIFSFQGADPAAFDLMRTYFGGRAAQVQQGWEVDLEFSFRSTRTVLQAVDGIFSAAAVRQGVVHDISRAVRHVPYRAGHAGTVELWPLISAAEKEKPDSWQMPVTIEAADNAGSRLAARIAGTIKNWIDGGEMLESQGRPIRAGDVLILVQSRGGIVELLLRALKDAGVPVAGIDRMTLTQEIAVMDLTALAAFALQPRDDLTLATILKSPLLGLDEDALFALCHPRGGGLWPAVQEHRPEIAAYLRPFVADAGKATPYEFFARILQTPCPADARSGRRALAARLGTDIHDALDEFLNACLSYEQSHTPALQAFLDWFQRGETEIKREQDAGQLDQVRIMTVHGSKGLQAPIVFLPDTVKKLHDHNRGRVRFMWPPDETGVPLWSPRSDITAPLYEDLRASAAQRQEEEYRRLFYVALTRAEDRLYIAGHYNKRKPAADCWYRLAQEFFPAEAQAVAQEEGEAIRRLHHPQEVAPKTGRARAETALTDALALPHWALQPPAAEPAPARPLSPSRPGEDEPAAKGPLEGDQNWKFSRGIIMHQVLQTVPRLPPAQWAASIAAYLARPAFSLPPATQQRFAQEIMAVLDHPDFKAIFGPDSRAEVPLVGLSGASAAQGEQAISGQIDRLLVTQDEILIVDYKTNRPPPQDAADVPVVYLKQMAAYAGLVARIYPGRAVKTALLWTDGPFLMPLPQESLAPYLPRD